MNNEKLYKSGNIKCNVSKDINQSLERIDRRYKYAKHLDVIHNLIYYDALDSDEFSGADIVVDKDANVEAKVISNIIHEQLYHALMTLNETERSILYEYYYHNNSDYKISAKIGIPQKTVYRKRQKSLKKLFEILKDFK